MNRVVGSDNLKGMAVEQPLLLGPDMRCMPDAGALAGHTPRISIGVFCVSEAPSAALSAAMRDRRLSRAASTIQSGGFEAAYKYCARMPTPDVLIVETATQDDALLAELDQLASVCDADTKVIVIGQANDIALYREVIGRGVSDYLVAPVDSLLVIAAVLKLYSGSVAPRLGRVCGFLGAKGGVGSSTLAQNVAWRMGEQRKGPVMLADLDLQFGTAALNLDLIPSAGFAEQMTDVERLDQALLERTLIQKGPYLHVLPASGRMHDVTPPDPDAVEKLLDICREMFPVVVLDLPHLQSPWMKAALDSVDDLVIVAAPDLANLRNAKCLFDIFRNSRPNDAPPKLVLNQMGIARRAGISTADFAGALDVEIKTQIGFDPQAFAKAACDGRLITEETPRCAASRAIADLARELDMRQTHRSGGVGQKEHWFTMPWRFAG